MKSNHVVELCVEPEGGEFVIVQQWKWSKRPPLPIFFCCVSRTPSVWYSVLRRECAIPLQLAFDHIEPVEMFDLLTESNLCMPENRLTKFNQALAVDPSQKKRIADH